MTINYHKQELYIKNNCQDSQSSKNQDDVYVFQKKIN